MREENRWKKRKGDSESEKINMGGKYAGEGDKVEGRLHKIKM